MQIVRLSLRSMRRLQKSEVIRVWERWKTSLESASDPEADLEGLLRETLRAVSVVNVLNANETTLPLELRHALRSIRMSTLSRPQLRGLVILVARWQDSAGQQGLSWSWRDRLIEVLAFAADTMEKNGKDAFSLHKELSTRELASFSMAVRHVIALPKKSWSLQTEQSDRIAFVIKTLLNHLSSANLLEFHALLGTPFLWYVRRLRIQHAADPDAAIEDLRKLRGMMATLLDREDALKTLKELVPPGMATQILADISFILAALTRSAIFMKSPSEVIETLDTMLSRDLVPSGEATAFIEAYFFQNPKRPSEAYISFLQRMRNKLVDQDGPALAWVRQRHYLDHSKTGKASSTADHKPAHTSMMTRLRSFLDVGRQRSDALDKTYEALVEQIVRETANTFDRTGIARSADDPSLFIKSNDSLRATRRRHASDAMHILQHSMQSGSKVTSEIYSRVAKALERVGYEQLSFPLLREIAQTRLPTLSMELSSAVRNKAATRLRLKQANFGEVWRDAKLPHIFELAVTFNDFDLGIAVYRNIKDNTASSFRWSLQKAGVFDRLLRGMARRLTRIPHWTRSAASTASLRLFMDWRHDDLHRHSIQPSLSPLILDLIAQEPDARLGQSAFATLLATPNLTLASSVLVTYFQALGRQQYDQDEATVRAYQAFRALYTSVTGHHRASHVMDVHVYNAIIQRLSTVLYPSGRRRVRVVYEAMLKRNIEPNSATFYALMKASLVLEPSAPTARIEGIFKGMLQRRIRPDAEAVTLLVDAHVKAGIPERSVSLLQEAGDLDLLSHRSVERHLSRARPSTPSREAQGKEKPQAGVADEPQRQRLPVPTVPHEELRTLSANVHPIGDTQSLAPESQTGPVGTSHGSIQIDGDTFLDDFFTANPSTIDESSPQVHEAAYIPPPPEAPAAPLDRKWWANAATAPNSAAQVFQGGHARSEEIQCDEYEHRQRDFAYDGQAHGPLTSSEYAMAFSSTVPVTSPQRSSAVTLREASSSGAIFSTSPSPSPSPSSSSSSPASSSSPSPSSSPPTRPGITPIAPFTSKSFRSFSQTISRLTLEQIEMIRLQVEREALVRQEREMEEIRMQRLRAGAMQGRWDGYREFAGTPWY